MKTGERKAGSGERGAGIQSWETGDLKPEIGERRSEGNRREEAQEGAAIRITCKIPTKW